MANIVVLGAGLIGKAIALDLATDHSVTSVDYDSAALDQLSGRNHLINTLNTDLSDPHNIVSSIKNADLVISAVPGFMGYQTLKTIIQNNKNVVDIAFFPEDSLSLDGLAKKHNVTAIVDMGVAPGLSNLILGYHSIDLNIETFKCIVGGLPKNPVPPFFYKAPFSPVDVIEEYTRPARIIRDGKLLTLPALSEIEEIEFDNIGILEAFNTDGLRTLISSFPGIPNMVEKTLRYPGHASLIQTLKDIGYLDQENVETTDLKNNDRRKSINPFELSTSLFKKHWALGENEPEFTVMRINISGQDKQVANKLVEHQYDLYDEFDPITETGSMARTTGYTCTAAANLILDNSVTTKGILPPESLGQDKASFQKILAYYSNKNIILKHKQTDTK